MSARRAAEGCGRSLALKLMAEEECTRGMVGEVCQLTLKGSLEDCVSGKAITDIEMSGFRGAHSSNKENAREKMYNSFNEKKVYPLLKYKLKDILPVK